MTSPPIVIDACSFRDKSFISWLGNYHGKKVIPSIAYSEIQRYFVSVKGVDGNYFNNILRSADIEVEPFQMSHGLITAILGNDLGEFKKQFRDYAIASHAYIPPWVVVTNNIKDFEFLEKRVMTPSDFIRAHRYR